MQPKSALQLPAGVGVLSGYLGVKGSSTDGQRWDTWGRLTQPLFSTVPHLTTPGARTRIHATQATPEERRSRSTPAPGTSAACSVSRMCMSRAPAAPAQTLICTLTLARR